MLNQYKTAEQTLRHNHSRQERSLGWALLVPSGAAFALCAGKGWKELGSCRAVQHCNERLHGFPEPS